MTNWVRCSLGYLVVIDAPFQADRPTPFAYGNGLTSIPVDPEHVGRVIKIRYWRVFDDTMFTIEAMHTKSGEVVLRLAKGSGRSRASHMTMLCVPLTTTRDCPILAQKPLR